MSATLIRNRDYMAQVVDFSGLEYGSITPTDIDGFVEFGDKVFVIIELKYCSSHIPFGQKLALKRVCDRIRKSGAKCYVILAVHETEPDEDIVVASQVAESVYFEGRWREANGVWTVKKLMDWILQDNGLSYKAASA